MNPPVPPITQERIVENANRELDALTEELRQALLARDMDAAEDALIRMRHLDADVRLAGMILGMLSPWLPTVADIPEGTPDQVRAREGVELGIRALSDLLPAKGRKLPGDEWRFPDLEEAVNWLVNQQAIVSDSDLSNLQQQLHREAFTLDADNLQTVQRFQSALSESLKLGESFAEFRTRVGKVADVTRSQQETIYRTNTKQAYLAGQVKALEQPRVRDRFRWVYYASTSDNRTRASHWALDGMVAEVGSPLHSLFLKRQSEFNCFLPGSRIVGDVQAAMRLRYCGQAVEIVTESGAVLRVTENHPVLTERGWVRAASLQEGQQLIRDVSEVDVVLKPAAVNELLPRSTNEHDGPSCVEQIFGAFAAAGTVESAGCGASHFHGDGEFVNGDVEIVWPRRKLLRAWESAVADQFSDLVLEPATLGVVSMLDLARSCGLAHAAPFQSLRVGRSTRLESVLGKAAIDHLPRNTEAFSERIHRLASDERIAQLGFRQDDFAAAGWHSEPLHPLADGFRLASELLRDLKDGQSALVRGDKIVSVSAISHDGPVYDFQTSTGVIETDAGILVSNCRCTLIPMDESKANRYGVKSLSDVPSEYR